MIKKSNLYKVLIFIILLLSFLSYEIHLYQYYFIFQIVLSILLIFMIMITTKIDKDISKKMKKSMSNNIIIIILFLLMIFNTSVGSLIYKYANILAVFKIILFLFNTISFFIMLPIIFEKYDDLVDFFEKNIIFFCLILSIIAILISIRGQFLGYVSSYRISGIYSDPNFFAMVLAIGILLIIKNIKSNKSLILVLLLFVYTIYLTGSRGTVLGLLIGLFFLIRKKFNKNIFFKIGIIFIYFLCVFLLYNYLGEMNFFRFSQGSNGRYEMIMSALNAVKKSPIVGYGYSSMEYYLHSNNFNNASTHNSFIDYLFSFGIVPFIIYIYLIIYNIYNSLKLKLKRDYSSILIFMFINMNTILYNLGGVGISSLLLTIFMGYVNYNINLIKKGG